MEKFINQSPLFLVIICLIIGFAFLMKGADYFVEGSSSVAKRLKVPSIIIGLTIVAMGTSLPETAVSVTASIANNNALAISNVVGSNIFNMMFVIGVLNSSDFLIRFLTDIDEIEHEIKLIMDEINSPILSIPGINYRMGAMIIAEIGDFNRFDSPDKILAYAGLSPSTYQSGQLDGAYSHMEKRGSRYLRYALYNAAKYVCHWDPTFAEYLAKKRAEGKHYNVAISHAVKKLVRVIYHLEKTNQQYIKAA